MVQGKTAVITPMVAARLVVICLCLLTGLQLCTRGSIQIVSLRGLFLEEFFHRRLNAIMFILHKGLPCR
ncbi:hypothetical protein BDV12DRAFT_170057, partial [Aspergillus spectabilis]